MLSKWVKKEQEMSLLAVIWTSWPLFATVLILIMVPLITLNGGKWVGIFILYPDFNLFGRKIK